MKKFLFYLVQFTWALPQNLVGGIGFLALRKSISTSASTTRLLHMSRTIISAACRSEYLYL